MAQIVLGLYDQQEPYHNRPLALMMTMVGIRNRDPLRLFLAVAGFLTWQVPCGGVVEPDSQ